ncbi:MAG: MFS transporter, partial [Chloroflexota bacterium]
FAFSNLTALINYSATYAVNFLMSLYLQYIKGFSPQTAGLVLLAMPVLQAIFSPFIGRLSDRIDPGKLSSTGMALTTIALFCLTFLSESTPVAFITGSLMLLGLGLALFSSPNTNAVMSSVAKKFYGVASGTLQTMRVVGQMLSLATVMLIFALLIGRVQIAPEHYPLFLKSVKTAIMIFTVLCFTGTFVSLSRGKASHNLKSG